MVEVDINGGGEDGSIDRWCGERVVADGVAIRWWGVICGLVVGLVLLLMLLWGVIEVWPGLHESGSGHIMWYTSWWEEGLMGSEVAIIGGVSIWRDEMLR